MALLLDVLFPPPLDGLRRRPATVVTDGEGQPLRLFLPPDGRWRLPSRLGELPEALVESVLACEDKRFAVHPGVDPLAILRATSGNLRAGRVVSGGSTIPMQLARMAAPSSRTLAAKAREARWALQLSHRWSKRRLLETYLNLAPYGGNVEGVGAAAYFYFGKRPADLSWGEIALLVALPRSPRAFDPTRDAAAATAARDRVLATLVERGLVTAELAEAARRQALPAARRSPPFRAPHFAEWVVRRVPGRARLETTLDARLQSVAERAVAARVAQLRPFGIGNAAAVVLDLETREVRAMVGSADYFDAARDGQVNGAAARRSPGSTLKPFLYALAFDQGRIVPASHLLDVPTDFAGYVAENYDGHYRGRVTAREALVTSLNAPAVRLLAETGLPAFHALLRRGGLSTLDRESSQYGLPLVLGAGEVTLVDLTNLYATLANGGWHRPLRFLKTDEDAGVAPEALFSEGAARMVAETLVDLARPDLPSAWDLARGSPTVAWKTGTSYGHRDAWAVGFSGRYAIGVWVGNFDGRPVKGVSGSEHAGPLLFDLFRAAGDGSTPQLLEAANRAETIEVCALSHDLPNPHCPTRTRVAYLPRVSRFSPCRMHRRVFVDAENGELLAGPCLGTRPHLARVLVVESPELVAFGRAQGQAVQSLPRLSVACGGRPSAEGPRIVSPSGRTAYRLRRDAPGEFQRIPLQGRAGPYAERLFWFEDGALVASAAPGETVFVDAKPGAHRLVLVDDLGQTDAVRYRVE